MKNLKTVKILSVLALTSLLFSACNVNSKQLLAKRIKHMQEASGNPVSIEEIKSAINKYDEQAKQVQMKNGKIGLWYKILGTRYIDRKMYGEALKCFQTALEFYPENPNLYYYTAVCAGYMSHAALDFDAVGNFEKKQNYLNLSESAYLRALQIDPRLTTALYGIGVLYVFELDENEKAIPYLERYLDIETRSIDGMFVLARAYYSTEQYDKAVQLYDRIISTSKSAEKRAEAEANKKVVLERF
ncbi:MAG: tetratricopeptide repeat protein [Treponema sp.]|nr:tetratricopeptide repeat protein [Treponema sp.]